MEGTITWFDIEKTKPTDAEPVDIMGIWVLCYYGPNVPVDSNYYWASSKCFVAGKKPTHWAYINSPKEV
jgi:hypothetical protein